MTEAIRVSAVLPAGPERIYAAWLSSEEHAAFTGTATEINPTIGGAFVSGDGYMKGKTLELEPGRRIVQSWRSVEFPDGSPDSRIEVLLEKTRGGTRVTIIHTNIPDGQGKDYEQGWADYYFEPMKEYFKRKE